MSILQEYRGYFLDAYHFPPEEALYRRPEDMARKNSIIRRLWHDLGFAAMWDEPDKYNRLDIKERLALDREIFSYAVRGFPFPYPCTPVPGDYVWASTRDHTVDQCVIRGFSIEDDAYLGELKDGRTLKIPYDGVFTSKEAALVNAFRSAARMLTNVGPRRQPGICSDPYPDSEFDGPRPPYRRAVRFVQHQLEPLFPLPEENQQEDQDADVCS